MRTKKLIKILSLTAFFLTKTMEKNTYEIDPTEIIFKLSESPRDKNQRLEVAKKIAAKLKQEHNPMAVTFAYLELGGLNCAGWFYQNEK